MKTFKIKYMLMLLTLLFGVMPAASAADRFYAEAASIKPGETKQLSFILENSQEFFGFQADIELPTGLTFVTSDGKANISLSSRAEGGSYNMVSNLLSENKVRLGAFSASHTAFSGNDGVLLYAMVSASEDFPGGTVSLTNVRFTNSEDQDVKLPDSSTEILVYTLAESITLSQTSAELKVSESVTLAAMVLPETTTDKTVTWSSSDENIATVDAEGKVTAIAVGTATITATCGSVRATCTVSVVATPAESITLSQTSAQLKAGESVTLTASVLPETATDKTVTWSS
ncbi:MAG: Ig-like domain-containing protein, partial [Prevotella sp.]|nr:Ig-like domain-containing protein [Prevotella sp.]